MALPIPRWIIVVAILLIILIFLFRAMNQIYILSVIKENFFYFFFLAFAAILVISVINIHRTYDFDFTSFDGIKGIIKVYFNWFVGFFKNIGKVTGYVIQQDWIAPANNSTG